MKSLKIKESEMYNAIIMDLIKFNSSAGVDYLLEKIRFLSSKAETAEFTETLEKGEENG